MSEAATARESETMPFRLLADVTAATHLAYLVLLAIGPLLAIRLRFVVALHVPGVAWALTSLATGIPCPLTSIEKAARHAAGDGVYEGGFIDHYLEGTVYPPSAATPVALALAGLIAVGYAEVLRRAASSRRDKAAAA